MLEKKGADEGLIDDTLRSFREQIYEKKGFIRFGEFPLNKLGHEH